jgi:LAO/AO transport system kinase
MDQSINPDFKPAARKISSAEELFSELRLGNKTALSKSITLIESNDPSQQKIGKEILKLAFPHSGKSKRIGITGVPGAGKSTFIESIGKTIIANGSKLAVLAIDPSSSIHKGSILGDKTRMQELSVLPNAFIRPTPSGNELGGVARNTFETIILCEAAGYDYIFIETVGVGQSETEVKFLTDFFILLMITGAGDELQGIKRGIMEMADLIIVNKADGNNLEKAKKASLEIQNALMILGMNIPGKTTKVQIYSSTEHSFQNEVMALTNEYFELNSGNKLAEIRANQQLHLFRKSLKNSILERIIESKNLNELIHQKELDILKNQQSAFEAVDEIIKNI